MKNKLKDLILFCCDVFLSVFFVFLLSLFVTDYSFIFKAGVSNLTIQGAIFVFCLFVRWLIDKKSFSDSILMKRLRYLAKIDDRRLLIVISILLFLIPFSIGVMRHFAFSSSGIDMGVSDQAVWNTLKGRALFSSPDGNINHLGSHFEPVYFLIVPLYFIWPNIIILIFLQAFAIGSAVFPLYLIAKERLSSRLLVFAFIFAYFFSRQLRGVGLLDFHTDVFLIPLAFTSYYLLITKRNFWAVVTLFLMLCCKESVAVLVFAYGIFAITYLKRYRLGTGLLVLATAWWLLVTNLVMPHFAHTTAYPYLKWLPFGTTYSDNFLAVIKNPMLVIKLLFSAGKIEFYSKLFVPLGTLSFLTPAHYVLFLLPLVVQIVGSVKHAGMVTITSHYPAHTLPFVFISAIYGAGKLIDFLNNKLPIKLGKRRISICLAAMIMSLSLLFFGKSDGHKLAKFIQSAKKLNSLELRRILTNIPQEASVSAVHRIVPHLTHRKYIYIWEDSLNTRYLVQYVVLHRRLIEKDKDDFDKIISDLKEKGFIEKHVDKSGDLFIFYNLGYKEQLLEKMESKMISLQG